MKRDIRELICSLHHLTKVVFREAAPISSSASVLVSLQLFNPCQQKEPKCDAGDLGLVSRTIQCLTRWRNIHKVQKRSQKDSVSPSCLPSKERMEPDKDIKSALLPLSFSGETIDSDFYTRWDLLWAIISSYESWYERQPIKNISERELLLSLSFICP